MNKELVILLFFSVVGKTSCFAWINNPLMTGRRRKIMKLEAMLKEQICIYDGAEYSSLKSFLSSSKDEMKDEMKTDASLEDGIFLVKYAAGTDINGDRWVGIMSEKESGDTVIELEKNKCLSASSAAKIPSGVSDNDAISTACAALVNIHCVLPRLKNVGGSSSCLVSGKVVVLGGGDLSSFASMGLQNCGAEVIQVCSNDRQLKNVKSMTPVVGEMELGFMSVIGEFDSLLDTLDNEGDRLIKELQRVHKCTKYISSFNKAQNIILENGVIFGPGKVKEYVERIRSNVPSSYEVMSFCPFEFGPKTLQKLLDERIIFNKNVNDGIYVRGWNLKDFWELTSWPRDSESALNSRFGLPVIQDIELIEENSIEEPIDEPVDEPVDQIPNNNVNPYVKEINGVEGLHNQILTPKLDCILFVSAPFCKACKRLNPRYTRMARINVQQCQNSVTFAKTDAVGTVGKELGKMLDVATIPSFVMFRDGLPYGKPLSITNIPSKKLDKAVEYLQSGMDWDSNVFRELGN